MRDYERLRKALGDLLEHGGMGGEVAAAVCDQAVEVLADTPETSEMERLVEWLCGKAEDAVEGEAAYGDMGSTDGVEWWRGNGRAYEVTLAFIKSEFGYGEGEDANGK